MPTRRIRLPGQLTGRRQSFDLGNIHFCAETCVHISPRQRAMLDRLVKGCSDKEIAYALDVSYQTIKNDMLDLRQKFQVRDRFQLALAAVASGCTRIRKDLDP